MFTYACTPTHVHLCAYAYAHMHTDLCMCTYMLVYDGMWSYACLSMHARLLSFARYVESPPYRPRCPSGMSLLRFCLRRVAQYPATIFSSRPLASNSAPFLRRSIRIFFGMLVLALPGEINPRTSPTRPLTRVFPTCER